MRVYSKLQTGFGEEKKAEEAAEGIEATTASTSQDVENIEDIDWEKVNTEPAADRRKPKVRTQKVLQAKEGPNEVPQIFKIEQLGDKRPLQDKERRYFPKMMD